MCGLIGSTVKKIDQAILDELRHRGPDDCGLYADQNIHLGHTRLSIIDLKNGHQPMSFGSVVLVFNGEIYNFIGLRDELIGLGMEFETNSDTEVFLKAYCHFGLEETLEKINGMFACTIYDQNKGVVYLVRDRIGIKPLFYSTVDGLSFCSELAPLASLINACTIDDQAASIFFSLYYIPSPFTIWKEISSLPPGHFLKFDIDDRSFSLNEYWKVPYPDRKPQDLEKLNELILDSTRMRMQADVPYGAYLSGGVDSSLIVRSMSGFDDDIKTFTAVIDDPVLNEASYAKRVSEEFKTNHHELPVSTGGIDVDFLRNLVKHFGQPFADSSMIPTYLISREITAHVTVALGGDGADECFCGYDKYTNLDSAWDVFPRNANQDVLTPRFRHPVDQLITSILPHHVSDQHELLRLLDVRIFLEGDILQKIDVLSMMNSLEARVPLLDHRIVEYSSHIDRDNIFGDVRKRPLKDLLSRNFEAQFVHRPKVGFMLNVKEWMPTFDGYLMASPHVSKFLAVHPSKIQDDYFRFAALIFLLWYEQYIDVVEYD